MPATARCTALVCIALIVIGTFAPGIVSAMQVSIVLDVWTLTPPAFVSTTVDLTPSPVEQPTSLLDTHLSRPPPSRRAS